MKTNVDFTAGTVVSRPKRLLAHAVVALVLTGTGAGCANTPPNPAGLPGPIGFVDEPAEVPATDVPTTDVPATEVPTTDVPIAEVPIIDVSTSEAPPQTLPEGWTPFVDDTIPPTLPEGWTPFIKE